MKKIKGKIGVFFIVLMVVLFPLTSLANTNVSNEVNNAKLLTKSSNEGLIDKIDEGKTTENEEDTKEPSDEEYGSDYIDFPGLLVNGEGTITISDSITEGYTLYYQFVHMTNEAYNQHNQTIETGNAEYDEFVKKAKKEIEELDADLEILKADAEAKQEEDPDSEEAKEAIKAYNDALEKRNERVKELSEEEKAFIDEYEQKLDDLTPKYVESDWKETANGDVKLDIQEFSGERAYVLWARVVTTSGKTYHSYGIYTVEGTKEEDVGDNNETNTDSPKSPITRLPFAGNSTVLTIVGVSIILAIIIGYISYRKYKDYKNI